MSAKRSTNTTNGAAHKLPSPRRPLVAAASAMAVVVLLGCLSPGKSALAQDTGGPAPRDGEVMASSPDIAAPNAGDVLVTDVAATDAFYLVKATADNPAVWSVLAKFSVDGMDTVGWTGHSCVTGSGRYTAATFAPREFANRPALRDHGAFAVVVNVESGDVWYLPERVSLKYHTPGCGVDDRVVFTRNVGDDQATTEIAAVNAVTHDVEWRTVSEQVTSAVPVGSDVVAAGAAGVVRVGPGGAVEKIADTDGPAYNLRAAADGVDFLVADPVTETASAMTLRRGTATVAAHGPLGNLRIVQGRGGSNRLVGVTQWHAGRSVLPPIPGSHGDDAASLDGSLLAGPPTRDKTSHESAGEDSTADGSLDSLTIPTAGVGATERTAATVTVTDVDTMPLATATSAALSNHTDPLCSFGRNDPALQVMQPSPRQVEWAVDLAVKGYLSGKTRPSNWMRNGLPSYTLQTGKFARPWIDPGPPAPSNTSGMIPAQVMLGIIAQESNQWQAAKYSLPGIPGNPHIADYYGLVTSSDGKIIGYDYNEADCGYGVAQVTDGMKATDAFYTRNEQKMIATDYAVNITAGMSILAEKWNRLKALGIEAGEGDERYIESWYLAIWAYNSGIHERTTPGEPYGLGWANNPANADYPPDRDAFHPLDDYAVSHPGEWPYQERVLGWAAHSQYSQGTKTFLPATTDAGTLILPSNFYFCTMDANDCDPGHLNGSLSYCTRTDRHCWWHDDAKWWSVAYTSIFATELLRYTSSGAAEPTVTNPHPPACAPSTPKLPTSPDLSVLPTTAKIVDDVANRNLNLVGCSAKASAGTFAFAWGGPDTDPLGMIDTHQIGAGYGGHFYFSHTVDPARTANVVTGTWTAPTTATGWQRIFVHIPDHGADTYQADYKIWTGTKQYHRVVNQRWNSNVWVDLGRFQLGAGATVSLSNATYDDWEEESPDIAWDAVAFVPSSKPRVSYVSLGDSYSAGEGAQPYYANSDAPENGYNEQNACHRSPQGYPPLLYSALRNKYPGQAEFHFIACSGAEMPDIFENGTHFGEVPQLDQGWLDENTTHVTISIGGNDAGFGDIIKGCMMSTNECSDGDFVLLRDGELDPEPLVDWEPQVIDGLQLKLDRRVIARSKPRRPMRRSFSSDIRTSSRIGLFWTTWVVFSSV